MNPLLLVNLTIPPLFLSSDRAYNYPIESFKDFDGSTVSLEPTVLEYGVVVSGDFRIKITSAGTLGGVQLRSLDQNSGYWIALTFDEAKMLSPQFAARASIDSAA